MDATTQAAFERLVGQIKAHPLFALAPPGAEEQVRMALADGIDRREAAKIKAALDTQKERAEISGYIEALGLNKSDVLIVLAWMKAAVDAALDDAEPVEVVEARYVARPLFKESREQFKCSGACLEDDGTLIMGVYGNDNPRNRCEIWYDGRKVFPARGFYDAETLFPYPNGFVVAERGYQLRRSGGTYKPTQCKARWAACMSLRPKPTIYNARPKDKKSDPPPKIQRLDFDTGAVIQELPGTDVPHDAAELPGGAVGVAVEGYGIVYTDQRASVRCKPRAYHVAGGIELVGDAGHLRQIEGGKLAAYLDGDPKLGEVVDSIAVDSAGIWLTTSNEDGLYLVPAGTRRAVQIVKYDDVDQGGSVFGCTFVTNDKRRVFIRNAGGRNSWEAFEIVADGAAPTPEAPKPTDGEPIDVARVHWLGRGAKGHAIASDLKAKAGKYGIDYWNAAGLGNDCYVGAIVLRDGVLYGGAYDGVGDITGMNHSFKSYNNLTGNGKGGPYFARSGPKATEAESRAYLRIRKGERFWVLMLSIFNNNRTRVVEVEAPFDL